MLRVTFIGAGAIAAEVHSQLAAHSDAVRIAAVVRSAAADTAPEPGVAPGWHGVPVVAAVPWDASDLVIEMAGIGAVIEHVVPALRRGIPCFICSVGALAVQQVADEVRAAAEQGGTSAQLMSGAIGAIDALAAAAVGGLDSVHYTGRKPPQAWSGTPAEAQWPLDLLTVPTVVFEGSARQAALQFPKNANVAATVALAGVGFDRTRVTLIADPGADCNVHHIAAAGAFGELAFSAHNLPSPDNPKTSALTAWSVVRAVLNRVDALRF